MVVAAATVLLVFVAFSKHRKRVGMRLVVVKTEVDFTVVTMQDAEDVIIKAGIEPVELVVTEFTGTGELEPELEP